MKRLLPILFFVALTFQSVYNAFVVIDFYVHRDFIAKNWCVNRFDKIPVCKGSCYLDKQLTQTATPEKSTVDLKWKHIEQMCHEFTFSVDLKQELSGIQSRIVSKEYTLLFSYSRRIDHPPRC